MDKRVIRTTASACILGAALFAAGASASASLLDGLVLPKNLTPIGGMLGVDFEDFAIGDQPVADHGWTKGWPDGTESRWQAVEPGGSGNTSNRALRAAAFNPGAVNTPSLGDPVLSFDDPLIVLTYKFRPYSGLEIPEVMIAPHPSTESATASEVGPYVGMARDRPSEYDSETGDFAGPTFRYRQRVGAGFAANSRGTAFELGKVGDFENKWFQVAIVIDPNATIMVGASEVRGVMNFFVRNITDDEDWILIDDFDRGDASDPNFENVANLPAYLSTSETSRHNPENWDAIRLHASRERADVDDIYMFAIPEPGSVALLGLGAALLLARRRFR